MTTKFLTREDILNRDDIVRETVEVPEWGGSVVCRTLTGLERDRIESAAIANRGKSSGLNTANLRARYVAAGTEDGNGVRIFEEEHVAALGNKSAAALDRLFTVILRLSGVTQEDVDELTQELRENPLDEPSSS